MKNKENILVSACLLGVNCTYNQSNNLNKKIIALSKTSNLIPICPEQLGGLPTPRTPSEIIGNKVITCKGEDVTKNYKFGAKETLKIAKEFNCKKAIFKFRSPSCGSNLIYDGTFSHKLKKGDGITTKLLKKNGIKVISEKEYI